MNDVLDDLTERAFAPRRKLSTVAALVVALNYFDRDGTNVLTMDYSPRNHPSDELNTSPKQPKGN